MAYFQLPFKIQTTNPFSTWSSNDSFFKPYEIPWNHIGQALDLFHTLREQNVLHQAKSEGTLQIIMFEEIANF